MTFTETNGTAGFMPEETGERSEGAFFIDASILRDKPPILNAG